MKETDTMWNVYVDDQGNEFPHCPECTVDVELDWERCENCGYPDDDFDEGNEEAEANTATAVSRDSGETDWRTYGF